MESSSLLQTSKRPDVTQTLNEEIKFDQSNDVNDLQVQALKSQLGPDQFNLLVEKLKESLRKEIQENNANHFTSNQVDQNELRD